MYFDTHAHYDSYKFDGDRDSVLTSLQDYGISLIVNPGCDRESSDAAIALAERYPFIWAAIGWHPHDASKMDTDGEDYLYRAAAHHKVAAIGEAGLDYHYDFSPRDVQRSVFIRQLQAARDLGMPIIVHDREAHADCLESIRRVPGVTGVFHCYSGSAEMVRDVLGLGFMISFTGVVTFKNARKTLEAVRAVPLDRLMIETDAPYLTPEPHRGARCDSSYLPLTAAVVAQTKGVTLEQLAEITTDNGRQFFGISSNQDNTSCSCRC